ncbi:MAG: class IV adenylate cyclase [Halobacteriota archaeon]|uniref:class IV adenylate cyclase n=1 Tax=Natronomonas sp. TaxID=2184060 RepID=UPI003976929D
MYEVELKLRVEHQDLRERLATIDAKPVGTVTQVDTYYNHLTRNFAETDEALRIRRETTDSEKKAKLTYKGPLVDADSKTREELETSVGDEEIMAAILESVGFDPAATVEKTRERFRCGEYTVTLDSVTGLGEFIEVETEAEKIDPAREGAVELLERLDLDPDQGIRRSYLGLLLDAE